MNLYIHAYIQYAVSIPFGNLTVRYGSHDPFSSMIYHPKKLCANPRPKGPGVISWESPFAKSARFVGWKRWTWWTPLQ